MYIYIYALSLARAPPRSVHPGRRDRATPVGLLSVMPTFVCPHAYAPHKTAPFHILLAVVGAATVLMILFDDTITQLVSELALLSLEAVGLVVVGCVAPTTFRASPPSRLLGDPAAAELVRRKDTHSQVSGGICMRAPCSIQRGTFGGPALRMETQ